jgi:hypothetical protein
MDAVTEDIAKPIYAPIPTIVDAIGCTGTCVYKWNGQSYGWVSGSCTGGTNCQPCPPSFGTDLRALVLQLPALFSNPNNIALRCGVVPTDLLPVPMIQLYLDATQNNTDQVLLTQTINRYRNTVIGLGVLSLLLLAGLVYALFFR